MWQELQKILLAGRQAMINLFFLSPVLYLCMSLYVVMDVLELAT